ncbi:hypothetical protein ACH4UM_25395 [Streptomyces sp. NPDC020801]
MSLPAGPGEAAGGAEAVERAAVLDPDVILMDLRMPGGSSERPP